MKKPAVQKPLRHNVAANGFRPFSSGNTNNITPAIIEGVRALLVSGGMDRERVEKAIAYIEGRVEVVGADEYERAIHQEPIEELQIVTRPQLAKLLKCGVRNIDYHRRAGHLQPVYIAGTKRARGYSAESVRALLRGEYANENAEMTEVR